MDGLHIQLLVSLQVKCHLDVFTGQLERLVFLVVLVLAHLDVWVARHQGVLRVFFVVAETLQLGQRNRCKTAGHVVFRLFDHCGCLVFRNLFSFVSALLLRSDLNRLQCLLLFLLFHNKLILCGLLLLIMNLIIAFVDLRCFRGCTDLRVASKLVLLSEDIFRDWRTNLELLMHLSNHCQ